MNKKVLKVLSYIGVGLLGSFLGMGALIGVSSCAQKRDDHTQISKKAVMPKRSVYNDDNKVNMNNIDSGYLLTFKSDFYQITKDFQRWYNHSGWEIDLNPNNAYSNWQSNGDALWRVYKFEFLWYGDQLWLDYHYLNGGDSETMNIFNYAEESNNHWLVNDNCKTFWIQDFNEVTNGSVFENFFKSIFDIVDLNVKENVFTFINGFNYNAFVQIDSNGDLYNTFSVQNKYPFVSKKLNQSEVIGLFEVGYFRSGGYLFNRIDVVFAIATTDLYFESPEGYLQTKLIDNVNPYSFVSSIRYRNTLSNTYIEVANRHVYLDKDKHSVIPYDMTFFNKDFMTISFLDELSINYKNLLEMTNNNAFNYTGFSGNTTDVGLGNVFSLISYAFTSMIPLMAIQIIPGITIGLLLFLPLIVGIVMLIIWLVKR